MTHPNRHRGLAGPVRNPAGRVTVARPSQAGGALSMVIGGGEILLVTETVPGNVCGAASGDQPVSAVMERFGVARRSTWGSSTVTMAPSSSRWRRPGPSCDRLGVD